MMRRPRQVLLALTTDCNLWCSHCATPRTKHKLTLRDIKPFIKGCKRLGMRRMGFTGGEPFLEPELLCGIVRFAKREGFSFDRITTNGVWYASDGSLERFLKKLRGCGYNGYITVSIDAFHRQGIRKLVRFMKIARSVWDRRDIVSVAYVTGARDNETVAKLDRLFSALGEDMLIDMAGIELVPVGKASRIKDGWNGRALKEDYCRGPGGVFYIVPNGDVKPCCGYASDEPALTIGNIRTDTAYAVNKNMKGNRFVFTVFNSGLGRIRRRLERRGFEFPGETSNHCYLCHYILTKVPKEVLERCLD